MRTGSVLEPPNISAFVFFALLAAAAFFTATDTIMRVWTTAMHMWSWCMPVRVLCVLHVMYVQPRYNSNRTASLCTLLCVCWHCMYFVHAHVLSVCVLWYANMRHVLLLLMHCLKKIISGFCWIQQYYCLLSNTAAHAPCFLQHQLWMCYLRVPFQLAKPPGFHVTHIAEGNFVYYAYDQVYVLFSRYIRRHFLMHVCTPAKKKNPVAELWE